LIGENHVENHVDVLLTFLVLIWSGLR
jgi:hypothetical protein